MYHGETPCTYKIYMATPVVYITCTFSVWLLSAILSCMLSTVYLCISSHCSGDIYRIGLGTSHCCGSCRFTLHCQWATIPTKIKIDAELVGWIRMGHIVKLDSRLFGLFVINFETWNYFKIFMIYLFFRFW